MQKTMTKALAHRLNAACRMKFNNTKGECENYDSAHTDYGCEGIGWCEWCWRQVEKGKSR